jgi:hypothetical protein
MVDQAKRKAGIPPPPMPMFIDTDYSKGLDRREDPTAGAAATGAASRASGRSGGRPPEIGRPPFYLFDDQFSTPQ